MRSGLAILIRGMTGAGVQRFVYSILNEWRSLPREKRPVLVHNEAEIISLFPDFEQRYLPSKSKAKFDLIWSVQVLKELNPEIVLYPKNIIPITHARLSFKKVNIIHDLAYFEKSLKAYPWKDTLYMTTFFKLSCQWADRILAVSHFTKKDAINRLRLDPNKIGVISEGVESKFAERTDIDLLARFDLGTEYYLYAGSISPRKNLERLLRATLPILKQKDRTLVITGLVSWGHLEGVKSIAKANPNHIRILGFVSEKELIYLYQNAHAFLYPSLYEGFGLPILEAQLSACPVLTSHDGACSETAGAGAVKVDPLSVESIRNGIEALDRDREHWIRLGHENAQLYTWKRAWNLLQMELKKVAENG